MHHVITTQNNEMFVTVKIIKILHQFRVTWWSVYTSSQNFATVYGFRAVDDFAHYMDNFRGHRVPLWWLATHTSTCWRVCGNNLNIISMCAVSPVVHKSNIS